MAQRRLPVMQQQPTQNATTRIPQAVKDVGDSMVAALLCATAPEHDPGCCPSEPHQAWFTANTDHELVTMWCVFHFLEASADELALSAEQVRHLRYLSNRLSIFRHRQLRPRQDLAGIIDFGVRRQAQ